jgi:predicted amino acid dehydrogenase
VFENYLRSDHEPPHFAIERRPLLPLFGNRTIPPVQAATVGYLPDDWLAQPRLSGREIIESWYGDTPEIASVLTTRLGRTAIILVPRFRSELYDDAPGLARTVNEAVRLAGRIGARVVSLAGLIPAATDYGRAIASAQGRSPQITTGHATTVGSVVLSIEKIARMAGRDLRKERVGFLGLGSIGTATLELLLCRLPAPAEIMLCDLYGSAYTTRAMEVVRRSGFKGRVRVLISNPDVAPEFYECSLIVGATNVPDVLDVGRLRPGTMIVDDSGPQCYSVNDAVRRIEEQADILFTDGGVLQSPHPIEALRFIPEERERILPAAVIDRMHQHDPWRITGCVISSLLTAAQPGIAPTTGGVDGRDAALNHLTLRTLGFDAADLHAAAYSIPQDLLARFRQRHGVNL